MVVMSWRIAFGMLSERLRGARRQQMCSEAEYLIVSLVESSIRAKPCSVIPMSSPRAIRGVATDLATPAERERRRFHPHRGGIRIIKLLRRYASYQTTSSPIMSLHLTKTRDDEEVGKTTTLGHLRLRHAETNQIILIPTSSNDPNDPLNC
jgi:hypothetical protein